MKRFGFSALALTVVMSTVAQVAQAVEPGLVSSKRAIEAINHVGNKPISTPKSESLEELQSKGFRRRRFRRRPFRRGFRRRGFRRGGFRRFH